MKQYGEGSLAEESIIKVATPTAQPGSRNKSGKTRTCIAGASYICYTEHHPVANIRVRLAELVSTFGLQGGVSRKR
jgi:hypothetical protein